MMESLPISIWKKIARLENSMFAGNVNRNAPQVESFCWRWSYANAKDREGGGRQCLIAE
jgi:hypothetical protein